MTEALRALLAGAIDYAGLFPPAGLDMPEAARNYANYRSGPHAWALGRFIVPSARLNEVDPDWKCVVLGVPPRAVEVCEMKVEHAADAVPLLAILPESVTAYFELPIDADPAPLAGGRAKVRTGGLTPDAFPAPAFQSHRRSAPSATLRAALHLSARQPHGADAWLRQRLSGCRAPLARGERVCRRRYLGRAVARRVPLRRPVRGMARTPPRDGANSRGARALRHQLRLVFFRRTHLRSPSTRVAMTRRKQSKLKHAPPLQRWGGLQPANARLRAHPFSPSNARERAVS